MNQELPRPDAPLRLAHAAEIAFPNGGMTAAGLRKEAARGNLILERIANKDYTTLAAIDAMRERCRKKPKELDSGSAPPPKKKNPPGSSETTKNKSALAAARSIAKKLKDNSPTTSPKNTAPHESADVIPLKSRSPMS